MKETTSRSHLIQNVRPTSVFYLRVSLNFFFLYMYTRDDFRLHTFHMDIFVISLTIL